MAASSNAAVRPDKFQSLVVQAMKRKRPSDDESDEDSGDEWKPPEPKTKKKRPANMNDSLKKRVIKNTAHEKKSNVDRSKYKRVWTCPNCRRPLAHKEVGGKFEFSKFSYTSKKNKHLKTQKALEPDHHPQWAPRERKLIKDGATIDEIRADYLDEDQLRALCRRCNGGHKLEGKDVDDYDSEDEFGDPSTPTNEPENMGRYSYFHDPGGGSGGTGTVV